MNRLQSVADVNVMVLVKGDEKYVWLFRDEQRGDALRSLGRFAANKDLSLTWYDAAMLSQRIRGLTREQDIG